jgi:hypothetical protein
MDETTTIVKTRKEKKLKCWHCKAPLENLSYEERLMNIPCPACGTAYAAKPMNEAKLSLLQEEFLSTRKVEVLNRMMMIMQHIIYNLICSKLKGSATFLDEEDIMDKVQWTLMKMHTYYSREDFKISTSFVEYLSQVILYPLYNYKNREKDQFEISINTPIKDGSNGGKEQTILDKLTDTPYLENNFEVENFLFKEEQKENVIAEIQDYIDTVITVAYKQKGMAHALKLLVLFKHFFQKRNNRFFGEVWSSPSWGRGLRDDFEKSLFLLRLDLQDSMRG